LIGSIFAVFCLPLMGVIALLIKMNSKGPVLHVQERLGYHGRTFNCLKFRSMQVNGDEQLATYLKANPKLAAEWDRYAKLKTHDPRLTPAGSFLRGWNLNEIPQIFNVLKGDMKICGISFRLQRRRNEPAGVSRGSCVLSLDEIPQIFNVLKGDMSLVGPRP